MPCPAPSLFRLQSSVSNSSRGKRRVKVVLIALSYRIPLPALAPCRQFADCLRPEEVSLGREDLALSHPAYKSLVQSYAKSLNEFAWESVSVVQSNGKGKAKLNALLKVPRIDRNMLNRKVQFHADRLQHFQ